MRYLFVVLSSVLFFATSAHAETHTHVKDFPNNGLISSDLTWVDAVMGSFSVAEDTNMGLNNPDHTAKIFLSLNKNFAISGNLMNSQDRTEKQQNTAVLFTFVMKSSF